jgi:hypothetical protein
MRRIPAITLSLLLAGPAHAGPAESSAPEGPAQPPAPDADVVGQAKTAWQDGDWSRVRQLLEPMVLDEQHMQDQQFREQALPYLADATLNDETLDADMSERLAASYLDRILAGNPQWRLPQGVYTPELGVLLNKRLQALSSADSAQCSAERNACRADLSESESSEAALQNDYAVLDLEHQRQDVELITEVKRSRAWALLPFGVGHFYNGTVSEGGDATPEERRNIALGATFLVSEAAFGATGLGLLLWRTSAAGCTRDGFSSGSLTCDYSHPDARARVLVRRKTEEVMGWLFLGTMAVDILVAQLLFKPVSVVSVDTVPRSELDGVADPKPRAKRPRASVRPTPAVIVGGGGMGIDVRF